MVNLENHLRILSLSFDLKRRPDLPVNGTKRQKLPRSFVPALFFCLTFNFTSLPNEKDGDRPTTTLVVRYFYMECTCLPLFPFFFHSSSKYHLHLWPKLTGLAVPTHPVLLFCSWVYLSLSLPVTRPVNCYPFRFFRHPLLTLPSTRLLSFSLLFFEYPFTVYP